MKTMTFVIFVLSFSIGFNIFLESCSTLPVAKRKVNSTSSPTISDSIASPLPRNSYDEIDLNELPADVSKKGNSPEKLALTAFGSKEGTVKQNVEVDTSNPEQTIVIITQTNLPDDSVNSIRYRIDFRSEDSQWQMEWSGRQFICQLGRGNQNWTKELCY